mmetsp:Transcript_16485/g.23833  ORF Transcript_16485/g.23833 Transcript_16485/m.23833 type:complete len:212 (-) Transcript_16485:121-756(-)
MVHERYSGWNIDLQNCVVGNIIQILDQGSEAVSVGSDQKPLPRFDRRSDLTVPVGKDSFHSVLEALLPGDLIAGNGIILGLLAGIEFMVFRGWRRWSVVAAAPNENLIIPILGCSIGLVQPLKRAVHSLVQMPVLIYWNPHQVHLLQHDLARLDSALEKRGVGHVELEPLLLQQHSGSLGLALSRLRQRLIDPSTESVLLVPLGFPVSDQY